MVLTPPPASKLRPFVPQHVENAMEPVAMGPINIMGQFMEHIIHDSLLRPEAVWVVRVAQAVLNALASIGVWAI
jgi:hypothetical protein